MAKKQRIGILGGTFDPVHSGHIRMGLSVLDAGYLDQLLVMPTGDPPHKSCASSAEDRWKMVVTACAYDKRLIPSRLELDRKGIIYTFDTLTLLKKEYPKSALYYVVGADTLMQLHTWHRFPEVLSLCTFLVCPRTDIPDREMFSREIGRLTALGGKFITVPMDLLPVSSTEIRSALASGLEPDHLSVSVLEYCQCNGLYGSPGRLDHIGLWIESLFSALKPKRFAHSLSVAHTAKRLAKLHGLDSLKAEQAGLLHDCAKCLPLQDMQRIAMENRLTDDREFLDNPALLHSLVGAWVAENEYGMKDPDVLDAIRYHNTGCAGMSRLAVCVCLSDSIEPLRQTYPHLEEVRTLAESSLESALLLSLEETADYVVSRGLYLHPRTMNTIRWLKSLPGIVKI